MKFFILQIPFPNPKNKTLKGPENRGLKPEILIGTGNRTRIIRPVSVGPRQLRNRMTLQSKRLHGFKMSQNIGSSHKVLQFFWSSIFLTQGPVRCEKPHQEYRHSPEIRTTHFIPHVHFSPL